MRADAIALLEIQGVRHKAQHFEPPIIQAEKHADSHIVASRFQSAAQTVEPVQVIALARARRMHAGVRFMMIGFLENLIGADAGRFNDPVSFMIHGRRVDIDSANFPVPVAGGVDRTHAFGNEIGVVFGMLAENQDQPLLPRSLELHHLFAQFFKCQSAPHREFIAALKPAIGTIIDAIVAHIERSEKHNPVAVYGFLQFLGGLKNTVEQLRLIGPKKDGSLFDA